MPGFVVRVKSLAAGETPSNVGMPTRQTVIEAHVPWRFGATVGELAQAITGSSVMATGGNIDALLFNDEMAAPLNSGLERIHRAGLVDGAGLDQFVRLLRPSGANITFNVGPGVAQVLRQHASRGAMESYLRGLASRVRRGTVLVTQGRVRIIEISCPIPPV